MNFKRTFIGFGVTLSISTSAYALTVEEWLNGEAFEGAVAVDYEGNPVTLKFSSPNPAASLVPQVWERGFDRLEKETNGKLQIEEYHGGTLHAAADGWRAVRSGVTDYATCYTSYEGSGFPLHKAFELPFVQLPIL